MLIKHGQSSTNLKLVKFSLLKVQAWFLRFSGMALSVASSCSVPALQVIDVPCVSSPVSSSVRLGTPSQCTIGQLCLYRKSSVEYGAESKYHKRMGRICCIAASEKTLGHINVEEGEVLPKADSALIPTSYEIQTLLAEICDETKIAEFKIKVGSFSLSVKRNVGHVQDATPSIAPHPATKPPEPASPMPSPPTKLSKKPTIDPSVFSPAVSKAMWLFGLLEGAADEGVQFITSPKVGLFRRGRRVKGKEGPPMCEEGQTIKQGQVVCYVEQLGTQTPVEAEDNGEIIKILWEDGDPIGYGDPLIVVRPTFPGIKKLT